MIHRRYRAWILGAVLLGPFLLDLAACSAPEAPATPTPNRPAPTLDEIGGATVTGLQLLTGPVVLVDGGFRSGRTEVGLVRALQWSGPLDGGSPATAVILWESGGGSGTFNSVAVFAWRDGRVLNLGTAPLGDRVRVQAGRIEGGSLVLDVLQPGPDDPRCCPAELATRTFRLADGALRELPPVVNGRAAPPPVAPGPQPAPVL